MYLCVGGLTLTDMCVAFMTFPKSKGTVSVIGTQWDYNLIRQEIIPLALFIIHACCLR